MFAWRWNIYKDPQKSIPKGTLLAILLTSLSYVVIAGAAAACVLRDAPAGCGPDGTPCTYGLQHSNDVIRLVSAFGPLIYGGCFAATLSSALASLVSAPKVFQALCQDKLYPWLEFFAKGYGANNEPVRGYVLTFVIAVAFILIGGLNQIAPLISNFFLAAYALINFATFHASLVKPVGWRPTFRLYNMWLSLAGALVCAGIMFVISWFNALLTLAALLALYLLVSYRKPDVNWGSSTQAQSYKAALSGVLQLNTVTEHVKNYRPQILVLTGFPGERPVLSDFTYLLTKGMSLMLCGHIVESQVSHRTREALTSRAYHWLDKRKIKGFYTLVDDVGFKEGATALIQASGLGKLKPNILLMGFKEDWQTCPREALADYIDVMHKALDVHMALAVLRVSGGLHCEDTLDPDLLACLRPTREDPAPPARPMGDGHKESKSTESLNSQSRGSSMSDVSADELRVNSRPDFKHAEGHSPSARSVVCRFPRGGGVDVWWLYDDGGLTLLLPYILSAPRGALRVFTLADNNDELEIEERNMASLLSKFRIDYSALKMIPDVNKKPKDATLAYFDRLIEPFRTTDEANDGTGISDADLLAARSRTHRYLRVRELVSVSSCASRLVVVTQPMPRRRGLPGALYSAWLHALATAAPRVLLVRGNHASVLTFYS